MPESEEYSFQKIWETIYNKVSEIATWNDAIIWAVYNHDVKIEWWIDLPAITITPSNSTNVKPFLFILQASYHI